MALATVIAFPSPKPQPVRVGNIYVDMATRLIESMAGDRPMALRIDDEGRVTLVDLACDFFAEAVTAPGFGGFCSGASDPELVAANLREGHIKFLAWIRSLCVDATSA